LYILALFISPKIIILLALSYFLLFGEPIGIAVLIGFEIGAKTLIGNRCRMLIKPKQRFII